MEQYFVCGEHGGTINIFCETCDKLMCSECLGPHSEKNCKPPIGLLHYASKQVLPKCKGELDMFERDKESFERSIGNFISSSKDIKQEVIRLKNILDKLLEIMEALERLTNIPDKASFYYDSIRKNLIEKYENMKEAITNKNMAYIIKNKGEHDLKTIVEIHSKQKELIDFIRKPMDNLLKSKEIEQITKGLQELYSSHTAFMKYQGNKVSSKFLYGIIRSQDDFKLLCKYDIKTKKLIPTIPVKYRATVTQIGSRVFITGGCNPLANTVHEFIESTQSLIAKMPMNYAKYLHSTQVLLPDTFVTLGGYDSKKAYTYCEEYSTYKNEWAILPSLNNARYGSGTLLLNDKYLYAIGGSNSNSTIERLDITQKNRWILLNLASNELSIDKSPRAFFISDSEALILSGNYTDEVVGIYDINASTIKKSEMTTAKDYYYYGNVCNIGSYIVVIGTRGNVVSYNLKTKKLETISYSKIYP